MKSGDKARQYVGADHIWTQVFSPDQTPQPPRPALFLDRDGVIIEEVHYLRRPEDVKLIDGAADQISKAQRQGFRVVVVTNQSGLARGYFDWATFEAVQQEMIAQLRRHDPGAVLDAVYACPFHKNGQVPFQHPDHPDRKPNPGMILRAQHALNLDLKQSLIVGDKASDLSAGRRAGLGHGVHVFTGHGSDAGERDKACDLASSTFQVSPVASIKDLSF